MKFKKYLSIIGILIFIYILFKLDIGLIFSEIKNAKIIFLIVAMFFVFVSLITSTLKWFIISKIQKTNVSFKEAFKINLIGIFYGFITPSKIGGIVRADYLKKYNKNYGKGISNFIIDKIMDICSLIFLSVVFFFMIANLISINYFYYFIILFLFMIGFLFMFHDKKRTRFALRLFYQKIVPVKLKDKLREGFNSFYENMPKKRYFALFFLFNVVNWITLYTITFFIGISLGINISFLYYLSILPITTLIAQIPISPGGMGVREASMIGMFGLVGVEATKVFSMAILALFLSSIIPSITAIFLMLREKSKINEDINSNSSTQ